jgi:hypothetical protein
MRIDCWWNNADRKYTLMLGENLSATFSTTSATQSGLELNPFFRSERTAINRLSHGTDQRLLVTTDFNFFYYNKIV